MDFTVPVCKVSISDRVHSKCRKEDQSGCDKFTEGMFGKGKADSVILYR